MELSSPLFFFINSVCLWIGNDLYNIMIMSAIKHFSFISAARFLLGFSFNQIQPKFNRLVLCLWATLHAQSLWKFCNKVCLPACLGLATGRQTEKQMWKYNLQMEVIKVPSGSLCACAKCWLHFLFTKRWKKSVKFSLIFPYVENFVF